MKTTVRLAGCLLLLPPLAGCSTSSSPASSDAGAKEAASTGDAAIPLDTGAPDVADAAMNGEAAPPADAGVDAGPCTTCRLLLFGGDDGISIVDTWLWNGASWQVQIPPATPMARSEATIGAVNGKTMLFGGHHLDFQGGGNVTLADTWTWDGMTWTELFPITVPSARSNSGYAVLAGELVVFGGYDGMKSLGDTWLWDGTGWTQASPATSPVAMIDPALAPLGDKVVLFGGFDGNNALADTWLWDGATWTKLGITGPPGRYDAAVATSNGKVVLFGGMGDTVPLGDTWEFDGATWTQRMVTGPSPRYASRAATLNGKVVLFGGFDLVPTSFADTWEWDGASWMKQAAGGPSGRGDVALSTTPP